jgi:hypothetical protein
MAENRIVKYVFGTIGILVCVLLSGGPDSSAEPSQDPASIPVSSLIASVQLNEPVDFCGEPVPLGNRTVRERLEKEFLLMLWNRPQVILWMKRYNRYMPHVEKMLKENDMPDDLKYVAVIESALRPHIRSYRGAVGFWQFIKATGRRYGLTINARVDERRNLFTSTKAAISYFKALYEILGSWTLSAAAYNMGHEGLLSEMLAQDINDYYRLYLNLETRRFIFKIVAAKLILSRPEKYGFVLRKEDLYPVLQFDRVRFTSKARTPLLMVARAAKTDFRVIKELNPEIRGYYIYEGEYRLQVPKGAGKEFYGRYATLLRQSKRKRNDCTYRVQKGDSLSAIAERFGVPLPILLIWNNRNPNKHIHPGERLIVCPNKIEIKNEAKN